MGTLDAGRGSPGASGVAKYTPGQAAEGAAPSAGAAREALKFVLSREGAFFREFLMNELVVSIDGLSRLQLSMLVQRLGLQVGRTPGPPGAVSGIWC